MRKKIIDIFRGELFMSNVDVIEECLKNTSRPDENSYEFKKVSLIEDQENNSRYLIGDFEGDDREYGFTLKIFLYKDGKALGNWRYVPEANVGPSTLHASFIDLADAGFIVHGFFLTEGKTGKEFFIFFVEKPNQLKNSSIIKIQEPKKPSPKDRSTLKQSTSQKLLPNSIKKIKTKKGDESYDISVIRSFIKLRPESGKQACVHFLAYLLVKMGFLVQTYHSNGGFPELLIEKNGKYLYIHVNVSNERKPQWKVSGIKMEDHFYIFCHVISNEIFPDVYILKGPTLNSLMKRNSKISTVDKQMSKIKNSWAPLFD